MMKQPGEFNFLAPQKSNPLVLGARELWSLCTCTGTIQLINKTGRVPKSEVSGIDTCTCTLLPF